MSFIATIWGHNFSLGTGIDKYLVLQDSICSSSHKPIAGFFCWDFVNSLSLWWQLWSKTLQIRCSRQTVFCKIDFCIVCNYWLQAAGFFLAGAVGVHGLPKTLIALLMASLTNFSTAAVRPSLQINSFISSLIKLQLLKISAVGFLSADIFWFGLPKTGKG